MMKTIASRLLGLLLGLILGLTLAIYVLAQGLYNIIVSLLIFSLDFMKMLVLHSIILSRHLFFGLREFAKNVVSAFIFCMAALLKLFTSILSSIATGILNALAFAGAGLFITYAALNFAFKFTAATLINLAYVLSPVFIAAWNLTKTVLSTVLSAAALPIYGLIIGLKRGIGNTFSAIFIWNRGNNRIASIPDNPPAVRNLRPQDPNAQAWINQHILDHLPARSIELVQIKNKELSDKIASLKSRANPVYSEEKTPGDDSILYQYQCPLSLSYIHQIKELITVEYTTKDEKNNIITHTKIFDKNDFLKMMRLGNTGNYSNLPESRTPLTGPEWSWTLERQNNRAYLERSDRTMKIYPGISPSLYAKLPLAYIYEEPDIFEDPAQIQAPANTAPFLNFFQQAPFPLLQDGNASAQNLSQRREP